MDKLYNLKPLLENRKSLRKNSTETEKILWTFLNKKQLGVKFRRQYSVGPFILDFYSPEIRLGLELDGSSHDAEGKPEYDKEREEYLNTANITILHFRNHRISSELTNCLKEIKSKIQYLKTQVSSPL